MDPASPHHLDPIQGRPPLPHRLAEHLVWSPWPCAVPHRQRPRSTRTSPSMAFNSGVEKQFPPPLTSKVATYDPKMSAVPAVAATASLVVPLTSPSLLHDGCRMKDFFHNESNLDTALFDHSVLRVCQPPASAFPCFLLTCPL